MNPLEESEGSDECEVLTPPSIHIHSDSDSSSSDCTHRYGDDASEDSVSDQSEAQDSQASNDAGRQSMLDDSDIGSIVTDDLFNTPDISDLKSDHQPTPSEADVLPTTDVETPSLGSASDSDVNQSTLDGQYW